ncbi:MAG TPA: RES family NAD+ phosphorylase [Candidatus Acidoferrales bacterium]|nr:RES family NAD+ phosphorylase [Candidatus Acidoferrales bacterium]
MLPTVSRVLQDDTHRLIPSAYEEETVLNRLTTDSDELTALFELEGATNERLLGEAGLLPGITVRELVFGLSYSHIVNAAFTHANPLGSRFNGSERGAWYAGFSLETAGIEVAFHKSEELREINWQEQETFLYTDFLADFRGEFHDIRGDSRFAECLVPDSYAASQKFARELLDTGSAGIVYPSVRHNGGTCIACFRPALVNHVRKGRQVSVEFENAHATPVIRPSH